LHLVLILLGFRLWPTSSCSEIHATFRRCDEFSFFCEISKSHLLSRITQKEIPRIYLRATSCYQVSMKNSEEVQIASHNNVHIILFLLHVSVIFRKAFVRQFKIHKHEPFNYNLL